jgi:hypothetical protein
VRTTPDLTDEHVLIQRLDAEWGRVDIGVVQHRDE